MTKAEKATEHLDNALKNADEALAAGGQGRAERASHEALTDLVKAVRELVGADKPPAIRKEPGSETPAKKAAAKKATPAKKAAAKKAAAKS